ncbi:MAG: hypothetical protein EOP48_32535, partial [Sphingobacteriales bacterium]
MSIFSGKQVATDGQTKTSSSSEGVTMDRPRICCIDLTKASLDSLKQCGYSLYEGTLGPTMKIPNKTRRDHAYLLLDYSFPDNFHEYDILILDLTNEPSKEYRPEDHVVKETKRKSFQQLICSFPTTVFDPRPLTSSFLSDYVGRITGRSFLQVIFACESYEIEYERIHISSDFSQRLEVEKHNIYSFFDNINLGDTRTGNEVTVCNVNDDLATLLNKHKGDLIYEQTFAHPKVWCSDEGKTLPDKSVTPLLININEEIVSYLRINSNLVTFV